MKYYIFGNCNEKSTDIKCSCKKAAYSSYSLTSAKEKFASFISEVRYTNIYLVADFEVYGVSFISKLNNDSQSILPFFIIGEWHNGMAKDQYIRSDCTIIKVPGFETEYSNNLAALNAFLANNKNHIESEFIIKYSRFDNNLSEYKLFERTICKSVDLIRCQKKRPVKRVKISKIDWMSGDRKHDSFKVFDLHAPNNEDKKDISYINLRGSVSRCI